MEYIVDWVGFKQSGNEYILKEIAIMPLSDSTDPLVRLFKNPFPWQKLTDTLQKENVLLEQNDHGIPWKTDGLDYCEIGSLLRDVLGDACRVYVMDESKKKWLQRFRFPVYDISNYGYSSKQSIKCVTVCLNHNAKYKTNCALHNVKRIKMYLTSINDKIKNLKI